MARFGLLVVVAMTVSCSKPAKAAEPDCTEKRPINRACATDADCTLVRQQTSCCGDRATRGINRTDAARFEADEKICSRGGSPCKCVPGPEQLDVGAQNDRERKAGTVVVACRKKVCTSFLKP